MRNVVPIIGGTDGLGSPIFIYLALLLILPAIGLIAFAMGIFIVALVAKGLWVVGRYYYLKWKKYRQRQLIARQQKSPPKWAQ